jgi:hypothetical protein
MIEEGKYQNLPPMAQEKADCFIKDHGLFLRAGETADSHLAVARERYADEYFRDDCAVEKFGEQK